MAIQYLSRTKAKLIVSTGSASKGTRRRVSKTVTFKGKKDLERLYRQFEDEVKKNPLSAATVEDLLESYVANAELRGLSANTIRGYKIAEKRIISRFGGILARSLSAHQLEDFVAEIAKKYSPKTVKNTIALLDAAYQRAVRSGQLAENPCAGITLPKQKKKEIRTMSLEEIRAFVEALEDERADIRVGYKLCLMCGLRRGEVLGLREEDISLTFRTVSIKRARYRVNGEDRVQEPKTARSKRTLALPASLASEIDLLIKEHHAQPYHHSDYLIQDAFGEPLGPSAFTCRIRHIADISVHGLRHTFATMLNAENVDIAQISAELGHSNITTTANTYMHVFGGATASSRSIADTVDKVFQKKGTFRAPEDNKKAVEG